MNSRILALYATAGIGISTIVSDGAALVKNPGFWTMLALLSGIGCLWIIWDFIWTTEEVDADDDLEDVPSGFH